jgi:acetylornithine deacetylase/succinyl-diaminopimelate desuccinylase-like protein
MDSFDAYVEANRERFVEELKTFVRQPSVSAQGLGLQEMADLVQARLDKLGAITRQIPTGDGPPIVYGEMGQGQRTLLIYDHYDVQPPDPLELWESPPFEPQIRDGYFYGRGVADNKGDLLARIQAVEAWLATRGELPLRIKWFVEGEEEVGSPHLSPIAEAYGDMLQADGCLWETGGLDEAGNFVLTMGLKGITYFELRVRCAGRDLHSSYAPLVENPAWRLVWALSTLKDEHDRITIDGYMDHVKPLTEDEIAAFARLPFHEEQLKARWGVERFIEDRSGLDAQLYLHATPTCTICGIESGYTGPGTKTVLPAEARVKLDFRLVPDLTPDLVLDLLRAHLDRRGFDDVEIVRLNGEHPAKSPLDAAVVRAAAEAAEVVYGRPPLLHPWAAGSGPMYPLSTKLGIPAVLAGINGPGTNAHSPNENIRLDWYFQGMRFIAELIERFA